MPSLIRNLRARSFDAFCWAAMLLAIAGMASVALENVSFGHQHLAGGHALHHHHVYLGSHEHPDGHEQGQDHGHHHEAPAPHHHDDHDHEAPVPQDDPASQGTATVSAAPALFQPVPAGVPAVPLVVSAPLEPALALPPAARPVLQTAPPRGPPLSAAAPGSLD